LGLILTIGVSLTATAQNRYDDPVFTNAQITITPNVVYGNNMALSLTGGNPSAQDLLMDVYQPDQSIDAVTNRPLILVLHSGNFLPPVINGSATGSRKDSAVVQACKEFARRGYVVASVTYRLGWNPISTDEEVRRGTLLQAVYRAILDVKTCVRFMRKEKATNNNPYKIDDTKIAVYGHGTGGYIALGMAYLDKQSEMELPKFVSQIDAQPLFTLGQSYINTGLLGNIDGTGGNASFNTYQHAGYSNSVNMVMNVGGALADTSWINPGEPAVASVHCIRDPFAPFNDGIVVVPTTQGDVVDVQGANVFIANANAKGLNNAYRNVLFFGDPYTTRARSLYNQTYSYNLINTGATVTINNPDGLFPINLADRTFINRFANEGAPWDWWDINVLTAMVAATNAATGGTYNAVTINDANVSSNPGMSATKGKTYVDTVINYFCPRIMRQLQIGNWEALGVQNNDLVNQLSVYPNPSNGIVTIAAATNLKQIEVIDLAGKLIFTANNLSNKCTINTSAYNKGMYIIKVQTENNIQTTKLLVD
jgi:acetyl esterase/lipase